MQPICKHYLCITCIRRVYYIYDMEDIIAHLRCLRTEKPEHIMDRLKEYEYVLANQAAQIKELRSCPVCRR